jgi:hypothetical protein
MIPIEDAGVTIGRAGQSKAESPFHRHAARLP